MLLGYSNELYVRDIEDSATRPGDFRIALRLNFRPEDTSYITGGYDTLGNQSNVSAYHSEGSGIGRWDTSIDLISRPEDATASVSTAAGYHGNRGDVRLSHFTDADGIDFDNLSGKSTRNRTSLRVGTSIAFAGSKVAVGAPIRGGAFAIVSPHDSLAHSEIKVGSADNILAKADGWGAALVGDLPVNMAGTISVDVDDLPLGYSLGSGAFDTLAPYKAGYALEIGSDYSVSAYGTLLSTNGEPVSLVTGTAHQGSHPEKRVTIFTNAEGKFGAEGLAPGRWVIDMQTENAATRYVMIVPDGTHGLVKAGTLKPIEGSTQ